MLLSLLRLRRGFHNASLIAPPAVRLPQCFSHSSSDESERLSHAFSALLSWPLFWPTVLTTWTPGLFCSVSPLSSLSFLWCHARCSVLPQVKQIRCPFSFIPEANSFGPLGPRGLLSPLSSTFSGLSSLSLVEDLGSLLLGSYSSSLIFSHSRVASDTITYLVCGNGFIPVRRISRCRFGRSLVKNSIALVRSVLGSISLSRLVR